MAHREQADLAEPVTGMEFVFVRGGTFLMGDEYGVGDEHEYPVHRVQLRGFHIARFAVTQRQWERIMETTPSRAGSGLDLPVDSVSWDDALEFVRRLNAAHSLGVEFCLPTEAQWEYAARSGGRQERYPGGDDPDAVAWYACRATQPVGRKRPNGLGLFDMGGNIWEWCLDTYAPDAYTSHPHDDPVHHGESPLRIRRGGAWDGTCPWDVRCANRKKSDRATRGSFLGFRVAANG